MRHTALVPVPPRPLKEEVDDRVDHRAVTSGRWPALTEVDTRWRGSFGYFAALIGPEEAQERIPLCRIEYLGGDRWAFARSPREIGYKITNAGSGGARPEVFLAAGRVEVA